LQEPLLLWHILINKDAAAAAAANARHQCSSITQNLSKQTKLIESGIRKPADVATVPLTGRLITCRVWTLSLIG
jgi:hypothetical protein